MNRKGLVLLSLSHFVNDAVIGSIPGLLPLFRQTFHWSYGMLGIIVMVSNVASSVIQPLFGLAADRWHLRWLLPVGMTALGVGVAWMGQTQHYGLLLATIALMGLGSAAFHPEASRGVHDYAQQQKGLAQSIFQVGGNAGLAFGPLLVPLFLARTGLPGTIWLLPPVLALAISVFWLQRQEDRLQGGRRGARARSAKGTRHVQALILLVAVVAIRSITQSGLTAFLPLYYTVHFGLSLSQADIVIAVFLFAGAVGTFFGGPLSDRIGYRRVVLGSMVLGAPLALLLPYVGPRLGTLVIVILGLVLLSSFAVAVVYAQALMPGNLGMTSGLIIGFSIGAGGIGAAAFGQMADLWGIPLVLKVVALLPLLGAPLAYLLPEPANARGVQG